METWLQRVFLGLSCVTCSVQAQQVEPDIERQVVSEDILDSENWLLGVSAGLISIEDFGSSSLLTAQLTYQINEDWYISAEYSAAKAGLTSFEELSGAAPLLTDSEREWRYYGAEVGYVLLPGEVFLSRDYALNSGLSIFLGGGNVQFAGDDVFAVHAGSRFRLFVTDWLSTELTFSDYVFETTILAKSKTTHNLGISLGLSVFF